METIDLLKMNVRYNGRLVDGIIVDYDPILVNAPSLKSGKFLTWGVSLKKIGRKMYQVTVALVCDELTGRIVNVLPENLVIL